MSAMLVDPVEFEFRGRTYLVRMNREGRPVYRDKAHFGGQWTDAEASVGNASLDATFWRKLRACMNVLTPQPNGYVRLARGIIAAPCYWCGAARSEGHKPGCRKLEG
ncbi:MAG: hypothetical protein L0215_02815 [Gemmataceae bacterium]|nr:hypothetical protein [Gemmataceae bacterium]